MSKKNWFLIHGWLGLYFGLLLFVICLSGTIAVLSHEIDWLFHPELRVEPQGEMKPVSVWVESAWQAHPDGFIYAVYAPVAPYFAAEIHAYFPDQTIQRKRILINPYTAQVQGTTAQFHVQRFLRTYHMMFFLPEVGKYLVCSLGIVLLVSVISGLMIYKQWWKKLFTIRLTRGRRILFSDIHRSLGVWCLLFSLLMALTSVWYLAEAAMHELGIDWSEAYGYLAEEEIEAQNPYREFLSIEQLLQEARGTYPEMDIQGMYFPQKRNQAFTIFGQAQAWLVRDRANRIFLTPDQGELQSMVRAQDLDLISRTAEMADPLHFGDFAGLISKFIWFAFGLLLSISILAGTLIWYLRHHNKTRSRLRVVSSITWSALIVVIFLATAFCAYWGSQMYLISNPFGDEVHEVGDVQVGPWQVNIQRIDSDASRHVHFVLNPDRPDAIANYQSIEVSLTDDSGESAAARVNPRLRFHIDAYLPKSEADGADKALSIKMIGKDGAVHQTSLSYQQWSRQDLLFQKTVTANTWNDHVEPEVTVFIVLFHLLLFIGAALWIIAVQWRV